MAKFELSIVEHQEQDPGLEKGTETVTGNMVSVVGVTGRGVETGNTENGAGRGTGTMKNDIESGERGSGNGNERGVKGNTLHGDTECKLTR